MIQAVVLTCKREDSRHTDIQRALSCFECIVYNNHKGAADGTRDAIQADRVGLGERQTRNLKQWSR